MVCWCVVNGLPSARDTEWYMEMNKRALHCVWWCVGVLWMDFPLRKRKKDMCLRKYVEMNEGVLNCVHVAMAKGYYQIHCEHTPIYSTILKININGWLFPGVLKMTSMSVNMNVGSFHQGNSFSTLPSKRNTFPKFLFSYRCHDGQIVSARSNTYFHPSFTVALF